MSLDRCNTNVIQQRNGQDLSVTSLSKSSACQTNNQQVASSILDNFKIRLGLERGSFSLVGQFLSYLTEKQRFRLKKPTLIDLKQCNDIHIIPSFCQLPITRRDLVDRYESFGSCEPPIQNLTESLLWKTFSSIIICNVMYYCSL